MVFDWLSVNFRYLPRRCPLKSCDHWFSAGKMVGRLCSLDHLVSLLGKWGEKWSSHGGNWLLESHRKAIIKGLGAHDAILASIHDESAQARVSWVLSIVLGKEVLIIDCHDARNVVFAFKSLDLAKHGWLVLLNCLIDNARQDIDIALSASESNLWLDEFDEALNE